MGQRKRLSSRGDCHSQQGRGGAGAVSPDPNRPGTGWGQSSPVLGQELLAVARRLPIRDAIPWMETLQTRLCRGNIAARCADSEFL